MKLNEVSVAGLKGAIADSITLGIPLFIFGTFGIGKTDIVSSALIDAGFEPVSWFRGSHATPDTIAGVPYLDGGVLKRAKPEIIAACDAVVAGGARPGLFLDELNLSSPNTLAALLQLLLEKRLGEYTLPEGTPIIAAGNLDTDGSVVSQLPLPASNRMALVHYYGPTFDEWAPWAGANGVHPLVIGFLKDNPDWLVAKHMADRGVDTLDPDSDRWPTPRSWMMASRHLNLLEERERTDDALAVLSRYVGDAAALRIDAYIQVAKELTPPGEVLNNPDTAPLPDGANIAAVYMNLASVMQALSRAGDKTDAVAKALQWSSRISATAMALMVSMLMEHDVLKQHLMEAVAEHSESMPMEAFEMLGALG